MILTLCGSARFENFFHEANKQLTLAGHICFTMATWTSIEGDKDWCSEKEKQALDLSYLAKIEASDGVVMLNIEGYLGESSLRELEWSRLRSKRIYWAFDDKRRRSGAGRWMAEGFARHLVANGGGTDWKELVEAVHRKEMDRASHL